MRLSAILPIAALAACETSTDPGDGGFFNGVSGIASGRYEQQIATQEADVAAAETRNANLAAQLRGRESELANLKVRILNQRNALGTTDAATNARINRVLASEPSGGTDAQRLAALQQSIADARALSEDLAKLSG